MGIPISWRGEEGSKSPRTQRSNAILPRGWKWLRDKTRTWEPLMSRKAEGEGGRNSLNENTEVNVCLNFLCVHFKTHTHTHTQKFIKPQLLRTLCKILSSGNCKHSSKSSNKTDAGSHTAVPTTAPASKVQHHPQGPHILPAMRWEQACTRHLQALRTRVFPSRRQEKNATWPILNFFYLTQRHFFSLLLEERDRERERSRNTDWLPPLHSWTGD